jgi:glycosyltransferase involved in cell wall biosynthesis
MDEYQTPAEIAARQALLQYCQQVEIVPPPAPRSKKKRIQTLITNPLPDLALRLASPQFSQKLQTLLNSQAFDTILCEGLELAPFVLAALSDGVNPLKKKPHLVLDAHNAEWLLQTRAYQNDWAAGPKNWPAAGYSFWQAQRLKRYEAKALQYFDRTIAVSPDDKSALEKIVGNGNNAKIAVIPNGIDLDEFQPNSSGNSHEEPDSLVFTGTMDFRPNIDAVTWFASEIWPLIRAQKPQAHFTIVGRRPTQAVQNLAQIAGIEVTGNVPDARPYVQRSAVYVVPMRIGGGVRFKVLEALALGKAVVTTSMGADGIPLTPGQTALIANQPAVFAQAVITLLNDPTRRHQLGVVKGHSFVSTHFDWNKITPLLDTVLE